MLHVTSGLVEDYSSILEHVTCCHETASKPNCRIHTGPRVIGRALGKVRGLRRIFIRALDDKRVSVRARLRIKRHCRTSPRTRPSIISVVQCTHRTFNDFQFPFPINSPINKGRSASHTVARLLVSDYKCNMIGSQMVGTRHRAFYVVIGIYTTNGTTAGSIRTKSTPIS